MRITILGSSGFIGSALKNYLVSQKCEILTPTLDEMLEINLDYGVVYYCIGLTSDFRNRHFETVEAHVEKLKAIMMNVRFQKMIYLSSTRLYLDSESTNEESPILINSTDKDSIYSLSKALGESLCINSSERPNVVDRLSNVVGFEQNKDTFLGMVITLASKGLVTFESASNSSKDYISINDVVKVLFLMSGYTNHKIYNLASGNNFNNYNLASIISKVYKCEIAYSEDAPTIEFKIIDISRLKNEFSFEPTPIEKVLNDVISSSKKS